MHVVMTTDATGSSGVRSYSLTLTSALRRRGIQVTLVSIGPPPDANQEAAVPAGTRLIVTDYKLEWQEGLNGDVALSGAFIARLVDDLRPEIVHSNHYCYGSLATGAAKIVVAHNDLLSRRTWCYYDGYQTLTLAPLSDAETTALVSQLLGSDPSVGRVATMIAEKAAGNAFFAEEIVRDLAERGVLRGDRSAYKSTADVGEVSAPATLQATIAARIDRLDPAAKQTLSAAAVIGSRFSPGPARNPGH